MRINLFFIIVSNSTVKVKSVRISIKYIINQNIKNAVGLATSVSKTNRT